MLTGRYDKWCYYNDDCYIWCTFHSVNVFSITPYRPNHKGLPFQIFQVFKSRILKKLLFKLGHFATTDSALKLKPLWGVRGNRNYFYLLSVSALE